MQRRASIGWNAGVHMQRRTFRRLASEFTAPPLIAVRLHDQRLCRVDRRRTDVTAARVSVTSPPLGVVLSQTERHSTAIATMPTVTALQFALTLLKTPAVGTFLNR
jgi:hypothetical protein